ncbi:MAG: hypothetical protein D6732_14005 [Methanobacteriota archaeon]|nr:MAG: hypothetical protein D6732_14005 [Euryarchaeota archaeon]
MTDSDLPEWLSKISVSPSVPVLSLLEKARPFLSKGETNLLQLKDTFPLTDEEYGVMMQSETLGGLLKYALNQGLSLEKIVKHLDWKSFEELTSVILEEAGWNTITNFRFIPPRQKNKRLELDVIAENTESRQILVIDCKRYKTPSQSPIRAAVEKQKERVRLLLNVIHEIHGTLPLQFPHWENFTLYPLILTWRDHGIRFYKDTPIVNISNFNNFLNSFNEYRELSFKIKQQF